MRAGRQIDVRGPRFSAALTCAVLTAAFLTRSTWLLGAQVAVFAVASIAGLRWSPYGNLFRLAKRHLDLGPPPATEPESGPRFAQTLGALAAGGGLVAILAGVPALGWVLVLVVVGLSALLALTGLCVGCELHALGARLRRGGGGAGRVGPAARAGLATPDAEATLLLFTAPSCGTCDTARRVVEDAAASRRGVAVRPVDVVADSGLARDLRVLRTPTVLLVDREAAVRARIGGVPDRAELDRLLDA